MKFTKIKYIGLALAVSLSTAFGAEDNSQAYDGWYESARKNGKTFTQYIEELANVDGQGHDVRHNRADAILYHISTVGRNGQRTRRATDAEAAILTEALAFAATIRTKHTQGGVLDLVAIRQRYCGGDSFSPGVRGHLTVAQMAIVSTSIALAARPLIPHLLSGKRPDPLTLSDFRQDAWGRFSSNLGIVQRLTGMTPTDYHDNLLQSIDRKNTNAVLSGIRRAESTFPVRTDIHDDSVIQKLRLELFLALNSGKDIACFKLQGDVLLFFLQGLGFDILPRGYFPGEISLDGIKLSPHMALDQIKHALSGTSSYKVVNASLY